MEEEDKIHLCDVQQCNHLSISGSAKTNIPVEKEMDWYGAEVPHCMSIEDPEHRGEVQQLQQSQTMKQHHHQATLPPIWQGTPVLPAPTQPPQQVHQAWERQTKILTHKIRDIKDRCKSYPNTTQYIKTQQERRSNVSFTNGGVGSHIVAIVKTDKGQVGHVWGEGQDQEDSHYARHGRSLQTQSSE